MSIAQKPFGADLTGRTMTLYTMTNRLGASVSVLDFGAHIVSIKVPDREGKLADVALGYDSFAEYDQNPNYLGATVGRYGNRIAKARFTLNGTEYTLFPNDGRNNLHGGREGFDKKWWKGQELEAEGEDTLIFTYVAHDGEEGFPGKLHTQVSFSFDDQCRLTIRYLAQSDKDTVVNLTNHTYFNLAGEGDVLGHQLTLHADYVTDVDKELIPTGEMLAVAGTPLDFNAPMTIGAGVARRAECRLVDEADGYDANFVLRGEGMKEAGVLYDEKSGREMRVTTTEPGIQIYSGQGLNLRGKGGAHYGAFAGVAMETQHYPDSPNRPAFPTTTVRAGETYQSTTIYAFSVRA